MYPTPTRSVQRRRCRERSLALYSAVAGANTRTFVHSVQCRCCSERNVARSVRRHPRTRLSLAGRGVSADLRHELMKLINYGSCHRTAGARQLTHFIIIPSTPTLPPSES